MKQWIINKIITITSINILFLPNLGKLGSPRSRVSFTRVTDQLYSLSRKSTHSAPKEVFTSIKLPWIFLVMIEETSIAGGPGLIPGVIRNLNSSPRTGYVSFLFCPVFSPSVVLTLCLPHSGRPTLVYMSVAHPTGIWPKGIWVVSPGVKIPSLGRVNNRGRKKDYWGNNKISNN